MKTVHKYVLPDGARVAINMPDGAEVLTARKQGDCICVWARVDPAAPAVRREFHLSTTGDTLPPDIGRYLGTAMFYGGSFVVHVFEVAA